MTPTTASQRNAIETTVTCMSAMMSFPSISLVEPSDAVVLRHERRCCSQREADAVDTKYDERKIKRGIR